MTYFLYHDYGWFSQSNNEMICDIEFDQKLNVSFFLGAGSTNYMNK